MSDDPTVLTGPQNPQGPGTPNAGGAAAAVKSSLILPTHIGRYRIVRLLGKGGMGAVYEAEQDQPRRSIALKVIRSVWASPQLLRRFEQESQTLGRLHHPGIAQIYEAGTADTPFGPEPYFAMEIIHGKPLIEYANDGETQHPAAIGADDRDLRCGAARASARHHPSRPEARQHPGRRERPAQNSGFRAGAGHGQRYGADDARRPTSANCWARCPT